MNYPKLLGGLALAAVAAVAVAAPDDAHALGYKGTSRGYSAPRQYKPAPRPRVINNHRTTVVQQTVVHQAAPSSGGGFFSSFLGGAAGAGLTNMLMNDDSDKQAVEVVPAAAVAPEPAQVAAPMIERAAPGAVTHNEGVQ